LHIETTSFADGTYKLIQELDGDISEAQANIFGINRSPELRFGRVKGY
jgi:hypothetical protein